MCGILGAVTISPVNQLLYDGLQVLQHRGQDAAGIATAEKGRFFMHKGQGLVRDVFRTRHMRSLVGNWGIGHCRYPTAGSAFNAAEAQPLYVNSPFGLMLAHNGNLTNSEQLKRDMFLQDLRHMNTNSDSEVLLNVLAHEMQAVTTRCQVDAELIFRAVAATYRRARGAYAVVAMIAGYGLLAFRDAHGIRPLVIGRRQCENRTEYLVASESVAIDALGFQILRDVEPGEAVLIDTEGNFISRQCAEQTMHAPCMFEYVYLARPDSLMDGVSVYASRVKMGELLAEKIRHTMPHLQADTVIPIPDSSRAAALELATHLGIPYREGFVKNRYIGRTFIMPGQASRRKSVRQKLNAIGMEFRGKNVILVDDSIVRGTTSREIITMAREAGAKKVYFASASPPVRFPNVYGIDMPTREELIAAYRNDDQIRQEIGADALIYQDLEDLKRAVQLINPALSRFDTSCFDGQYITGDVSEAFLTGLEQQRGANTHESSGSQLDLNLVSSE